MKKLGILYQAVEEPIGEFLDDAIEAVDQSVSDLSLVGTTRTHAVIGTKRISSSSRTI